MPRPSGWGLAAVLVVALAVTGCESPPVTWGETRAAPSGEGTLVMSDSGPRRFNQPAPVSAPAADACAGSVRYAWADSTQVYAAWWTASGGRAKLLASYSADRGATWRAPSVVDSSDAGNAGCGRPAPGIATNGEYVDVVYGLRAPEGAGVFFSHSMDHASMFHAPVPIVYGDEPAVAAVAASGRVVAVAYEDPNTDPRAIGLALSRTDGHIFEWRSTVGEGPGTASDPEVAIRDGALAVGWTLRDETAGPEHPRVVRLGHLR